MNDESRTMCLFRSVNDDVVDRWEIMRRGRLGRKKKCWSVLDSEFHPNGYSTQADYECETE